GDSGHDGGGRAVGDRARCQRQSGGGGGGGLRRGDGRRLGNADDAGDHGRRRDRGRDLVDARDHGGDEHADRDLRDAHRQPGDVHGHRHHRRGQHDRRQRGEQPVGDGGDGGGRRAVGDRARCQRQSGGGGGGDVRGRVGRRDGDPDDAGDHGRDRKGV